MSPAIRGLSGVAVGLVGGKVATQQKDLSARHKVGGGDKKYDLLLLKNQHDDGPRLSGRQKWR